MPTSIVMPSMGMYTAEGTLVNWLHDDGAMVERGQTVLEIETEKAVNPVVAPATGRLQRVAKIGTLVKEEELLGYIVGENERSPAPEALTPSIPKPSVPSPAADEAGFKGGPATKSSPAARKLAAQLGVDLASLAGSGPGGRIIEADVLKKAGTPPVAGGHPQAAPAGAGSVVSSPMSTMRRAISDRLRLTVQNALSLTLTSEIEAGALVEARRALGQKLAVPFDAYFVKVWALALRKRPELNVEIDGTNIRVFDHVHVGVAMAVPGGLVVPVIKQADTKSLSDIAEELRGFSSRAQAQRLAVEELAGGTTTISNLGAFGVDAFTPILNPPQSTILGVGRIAMRPVALEDKIVLRHTCWLSLTFDHRVADGVPAAQLLNEAASLLNDTGFLTGLR